jgi:hypothetical protein
MSAEFVADCWRGKGGVRGLEPAPGAPFPGYSACVSVVAWMWMWVWVWVWAWVWVCGQVCVPPGHKFGNRQHMCHRAVRAGERKLVHTVPARHLWRHHWSSNRRLQRTLPRRVRARLSHSLAWQDAHVHRGGVLTVSPTPSPLVH